MKKAKSKAGFLAALVTLVTSASIVFAAAAAAGEMKSDPENYYLDPEEIRPIVRDSIETTIMLSSQGEDTTFSRVKEFDVRLIPGQIPLYTIDGYVSGYLYIGYAVPGPLPTFEEIINKARESYEVVQQYLSSVERPDWREFYGETFSYEITCAYEIVGTSAKWAGGGGGSIGIPAIIQKQKEAEEAARRYYGSRDFKLVRYIYSSKLNGYEFTDGRENIIVPFDTWYETVGADDVRRRIDVDANIEEYVLIRDPGAVESYFEKWRRKLRNQFGNSKLDYSPPNYEILDRGNWCYLKQTHYDDRDYVWKDFTGLWDYEGKSGHKGYPLLKRRTTEPRQYALFGKCWGIAAASNMAYFEGTGTRRLIKNEREGDLVRGIDTTEKRFLYPAMRELDKIKEQPPIPPYPNNYAAYMSLLIGAIYQGRESSGYSFFYRKQDDPNPDMPSWLTLAQICATVIEADFKAGSYYEVYYANHPPTAEEIADHIAAKNPFFIRYGPSEHSHAVTVYGYKGYDSWQNTIDELGVWDWLDSNWPDGWCELKWKDFDEYFNDTIIIRDKSRRTVASYVNDVEIKLAKKVVSVSWTNAAGTELDVLGYNVVERGNSEDRLNEVMIRPDARFGGGRYKFKLPRGCDAGKVAIQAVLKNGETVEYPVVVEGREAQENAR